VDGELCKLSLSKITVHVTKKAPLSRKKFPGPKFHNALQIRTILLVNKFDIYGRNHPFGTSTLQ